VFGLVLGQKQFDDKLKRMTHTHTHTHTSDTDREREREKRTDRDGGDRWTKYCSIILYTAL